MIWATVYLYLAGLPAAAHIASDARGGITWRKTTFVILWPAILPALYAWALFGAVADDLDVMMNLRSLIKRKTSAPK